MIEVCDSTGECRKSDLESEIERLRTALKGLHDWYVEYAKVNQLYNSDGAPATFHELLEARKLITQQITDK